MRTWWREGFYVTLALSRITCRMDKKEDWTKDDPNKLWDVDGFRWKLLWKDVRGNSDYMEEQLWAIRRGLA